MRDDAAPVQRDQDDAVVDVCRELLGGVLGLLEEVPQAVTRPGVLLDAHWRDRVGQPSVASRRQKTLEVLVARPARAQGRRDAGQLKLGLLAGGHELDVDVQHGQRPLAADVARVGLQELLELGPAGHMRSARSKSMYPLAASDRRSLRRASNIAL